MHGRHRLLATEGNMRRTIDRFHIWLFAAFLIAWTIALLLPVPHESAEKVLGDDFGVSFLARPFISAATRF